MSLEVRNIVSGYGKLEVLHGVSLRVKKNEITCVIGPNGCGKSTLLKTIAGLIRPKQGSIVFDGEDITGVKPHKVLRKGICTIPQGRTVFPYMTILENLQMGAYTIKDSEINRRLEEVFTLFSVLEERKKQLAGTLSGGEQTMLCIARALMLHPKIILADEPSLGLAPKFIEQAYQKLQEINSAGTGFVIVEQNVRRALSVSDYVYILDLGRNRFEGTRETILGQDELVKLYLGAL